ncbi:tRNA (adenine37-N(6))-methyltransferase TrmN6 [Desulfurella amilsii]|uniref:tRNA (Adenine37-N(6))-methyltransferase TrmN6 n=1 Tax=Desulfurella amilsii TaxID=1562698 RepID=A0A1X4XV82_9BACT|nr:methyltransferase [Desulfurella amilsii]OSS41441.1 tRNA (adenine37-N(6))-methyltransferase TrmN6 [Desulfurella amilsii]
MDLDLCDFKLVKVYQPKHGYRFSFEPFVLADINNTKRINEVADIGSGCGIIAILLSKKYSIKHIYAVENDLEFIDIITENLKLNNINNVEVIDSIDKLPNNSLDLVFSNPPYYTKSSFRISKKYETQKFENTSLSDMLNKISIKIKNGGLIRLSFHPTRLLELFFELANNNFGVKTIQPIYGKKNKISKACIVEAKKNAKAYITIKTPIFLEDYRLYE